MASLAGKTALVTGGGRGIGRAIALALAEQGADVAIAARSQGEIDAVAAECRQHGVRALPLRLDVTDEEAWGYVFNAILAQFGKLDILVNNAGGGIFKRVLELSVEEFEQVLWQNLSSVHLGIRQVAEHMIARGTGRIINISSMAAFSAGPEYAAYSAAKAGVNSLTETVAVELRKSGAVGVTCNAICPGPVASQLRSSHFPTEDPDSIMQPPTVADVAVFLASDAASGMSGAALKVRHF